jgi:hypothetical protein
LNSNLEVEIYGGAIQCACSALFLYLIDSFFSYLILLLAPGSHLIDVMVAIPPMSNGDGTTAEAAAAAPPLLTTLMRQVSIETRQGNISADQRRVIKEDILAQQQAAVSSSQSTSSESKTTLNEDESDDEDDNDNVDHNDDAKSARLVKMLRMLSSCVRNGLVSEQQRLAIKQLLFSSSIDGHAEARAQLKRSLSADRVVVSSTSTSMSLSDSKVEHSNGSNRDVAVSSSHREEIEPGGRLRLRPHSNWLLVSQDVMGLVFLFMDGIYLLTFDVISLIHLCCLWCIGMSLLACTSTCVSWYRESCSGPRAYSMWRGRLLENFGKKSPLLPIIQSRYR